MTRTTLQHLIAKEIHTLNARIDKKILSGKNYRRDAEKHRALMMQYRRLQLGRKMTISPSSLLAA